MEILENNFPEFQEKDREVTFLMNCLLGIIVSISENRKMSNSIFSNKIDVKFLALIPEKIGFITSYTNINKLMNVNLKQRSVGIGHKHELKTKTKIWFINKIRNAIAHQNISAVNKDGNWVGVILHNKYNNIVDFEIEFSVKQLKRFTKELGKEYLDIIKEKQITSDDHIIG